MQHLNLNPYLYNCLPCPLDVCQVKLSLRFSLALTICESSALFFVSSWCVNVIKVFLHDEPGRVAQSVTCLATDASLTADPGVASSIPARSHTFVEIDHEIISTVILLPSAESFKKGCCQLQAKVCAKVLVDCLFKLAQEKVWLGELTVPH